jgi:LuxR family maltose regulon positive regulatory protein
LTSTTSGRPGPPAGRPAPPARAATRLQEVQLPQAGSGQPAVAAAEAAVRRPAGAAVRRPAGDGPADLAAAGASLPGPADDQQPPAQPFLEDKLQVPQASLPVLGRPRLTELIERAAAHRVTLVSGPAGAGKTVACSAWAAGSPAGRPVAWVTLDEQDRDPARFWAYVRAALARVRTVPAEAARALEDVTPQAWPLVLVEAAQLFTEPVVLLLDDVHELAGGEVVPGLDLLIRHAPPSLRLILSGRCPPGLQLAKLRVTGELAEVSTADLACTPQEAEAYFAMLGVQLGPAERDDLLGRTMGWMAGLRLAAMRALAHPGEPGWATGIAGDEPAVTDYLADEVLGRLPEQIRLFLLRTSVAQTVSGDLADALTGQPGGARTLDLLSRENSFVESLDHDRSEFRYHPLLRDVLLAELHRKLPQEIPILLRRVARWHAEHGKPIEAVRCSAEAGDWDYGAHVLADAGPVALMHQGPAVFEGVLALFPADRRADDAAVATACAAARLWSDDPEGAAAHLDGAQRALGRLADQQQRAVQPSLLALRVLQAASLGQADPGLLAEGGSVAERAQASAGSPAEHRSIGLLWYALGVARLRRWEIVQARRALLLAERQSAAGGLADLAARARCWRALADAWHGDLAEAQKAVGELAAGATADGQAASRAWLIALTQSHAGLLRDDLGFARQMLDEANRPAAAEGGSRPASAAATAAAAASAGADGRLAPDGAQLPGEPAAAVLRALSRARTLLADGDTNAARSVLIRLREASAADQRLDEVLTVLDAEIALRAGDTGRARIVLRLSDGWGPPDTAGGYLAHGRLLLAEGDFAAALDAVAPVLGATEAAAEASRQEAPTLQEKIAALIVAAIAQRRLGRTGPAAELLEQALALAEPDSAGRPFLDAGPAARSAITVLIPPDSRGASFAARILEHFASQLPHPAEQAEQAEVVLTDAELAVLRFLPSHMTNQEIAEALFLSINTVKTHLRSVYRKLRVTSRRQAIGRGRRLDLL